MPKWISRRDKRIRDMWMRCYSLEEIAEAEGLGKTQIHEICSELSDVKKLNKSDLAAADHATDFNPPMPEVIHHDDPGRGRLAKMARKSIEGARTRQRACNAWEGYHGRAGVSQRSACPCAAAGPVAPLPFPSAAH